MKDTVRLAGLSQITRRPAETLRSLMKAGDTPWDDSVFAEREHRRFTAEHALAVVLMEMIESQGLPLASAAERVRFQRNIVAGFMDAIDADQPPPPVFVGALLHAEEDTLTGVRWITQDFAEGTADEIAYYFRRCLERMGEERRDDVRPDRVFRRIGGPWQATAPIAEAWRLLRQRARAAGYVLDGRRILKVDSEGGEDADA